MIVSNASPLIYLAKINKLELLKKLFGKIFIPPEVYQEAVVRGREEKFLDAIRIEKAIKDGWIEVNKTEKLAEEIKVFADEIDAGELETIGLARKLKASLVLSDDAPARAIAESFGLNSKGTIYVLLRAYKEKMLPKKNVKELVNELSSLGFRISQEVYIEFLEKLEKG